MSGYGGPDLESEHAQILNDNAIADARAKLPDPRREYLECQDCGADIPEGRRKALPGASRCVQCQQEVDKQPRAKVRMLDRLT